MGSTQPDYLSKKLFHFWGKGQDEDAQFAIFESAVTRGLLLTCGNEAALDQFEYFEPESGQKKKLCMVGQHARVCFTEVPLGNQGEVIHQRFGAFGVGFSRKTILEWGGCPVWYLPNGATQGTQDSRAAMLILILERLREFLRYAASQPAVLAGFGQSLPPETPRPPPLPQMDEAVQLLLSHVKQMSPLGSDDMSFLYEMEWRIVAGPTCLGLDADKVFRPLTRDEKCELVAKKRAWGEPVRAGEPQIDERMEDRERMVNEFKWFNGLPGNDSVAKRIETIHVPTETLKKKVASYLDKERERFGPELPSVEVVE